VLYESCEALERICQRALAVYVNNMKPSIVILTFNSAGSISATLERALMVSDDVHIVDSFSTDGTVSIANAFGAKVVMHAFENYSSQRNWAIDTLPLRHPWQLHLDADEWMNDTLIQSIRDLPDEPSYRGFLIPRYLKFLGRVLKHGAMSPTWHLRLFRAGAARCEARKYDQHFHLDDGNIGRLAGWLVDDIQMSLSEWTARHNRWSDAEVDELMGQQGASSKIKENLFGNPIEQKRYWRAKYNQLPLFVRSVALFVYRYLFRLGVLDGREGLVFWMLQTFWFHFLIDAKLFELSKKPSPPLTSSSVATAADSSAETAVSAR
jgi:glycosyltransferase involved in cell wall biosynthesis